MFPFFFLIITSLATYVNNGGIEFLVDERANKAIALRLLNDKTDLIIPNEVKSHYQKYPVVDIWDNFSLGFNIYGVLTIGENVVVIRNHAFEFQKITSFKMGSKVTKILAYAFNCCYDLSGIINLSLSLKSVGKYAFSYCSKINYILNSDNIVVVGEGAFSHCCSITTIKLPCMKIASKKCLEYCSSLVVLELRDIEKAYDYCLSGCSSLERLTVTDGYNLTKLTYVGEFCFANCVKFYELPNSGDVQYGGNCFYNCIGFNHDFQIISSYIFGPIFYGCTSLNEITFFNVKEIGVDVIKNCPNCVNISFKLLKNNRIVVPIKIHAYAFRDCTQIKYINIADSNIVYIGDYAFAGCSSLSNELVLPKNLEYLGAHAFDGCISLSGLKISQCTKIEAINISAFYKCSNICGILVLPKQIKWIGEDAFKFCGLSGNIDIPDDVEVIGNGAFYMCNSFTGTIKIGRKVKTIGDSAFYGCSSIEGYLKINSNVLKYIGSYAFYGCTKLSGQLKLPNSLKYIGDYAFTNCNLFTNKLVLPNNLKYIGDSAFSKCEGFEGNLVIPQSVETIGENAFFQCRGFSTIKFKGNNISIGSKAFGSLHISCMINVPSKCKYINSHECYDTDNFGLIAQFHNNYLGENCDALKKLKFGKFVLFKLSAFGFFPFLIKSLYRCFNHKKELENRMMRIYSNIIRRVYKTYRLGDNEDRYVDNLISLINIKTIDKFKSGFHLSESNIKNILEKCLDEKWPELTAKNKQRIINESLNDICFFPN